MEQHIKFFIIIFVLLNEIMKNVFPSGVCHSSNIRHKKIKLRFNMVLINNFVPYFVTIVSEKKVNGQGY